MTQWKRSEWKCSLLTQTPLTKNKYFTHTYANTYVIQQQQLMNLSIYFSIFDDDLNKKINEMIEFFSLNQ